VKRRKNLFGLPFAPATASGKVRRRFEALGRGDARKYQNVQDYSRTHALLEAEAMAQAGQHTVNQWLVQRVQPIIAGNARIELQVREVETDLQNLKSARATSGRHGAKLSIEVDKLTTDLAFLFAQHESNLRAIESLRLQAEAGFASWAGYFQGLCAIYSRSRTLADKNATHDAPAQSPQFRPIDLNPLGSDLPSLKTRG
jgi:hypothetical protein